jgi:hypothetical protein
MPPDPAVEAVLTHGVANSVGAAPCTADALVLHLSLKSENLPMSEAMVAEPTASVDVRGPRFRLSGLVLLVLAAALSLGAMSRAHVITGAMSLYGESPLTRWLGVLLAPCGVMLGLALAVQVFRLMNHREPETTRVWPVCWRLAALVLLALLLADESSLLSTVVGDTGGPNWPPGLMNPLRMEARLRILPPAEGLLLIGLILGMRPRQHRQSERPARLWAWIRTIFLCLAGIVIVAELMVVPYLVLTAVEAVENAKLRPGEGSEGLLTNPARPPMAPGLADRIDATIPLVVLSVISALFAAGWLSASLRRAGGSAGEGEINHQARRDLFLGLSLSLALLVTTGILVGRGLPSVQSLFGAGLRAICGGWEFAVATIGFGGFSAGLVAHVLAPEFGSSADPGDGLSGARNRQAVWMFKALVATFLVVVILSSLEEIRRSYPAAGRVLPGWLLGLAGPLSSSISGIWAWIKANGWFGLFNSDASPWFPAVIIPWLVWRSVGLLMAAGTPHAPLDRLVESRAMAGRFVGYFSALSALLIAAVPILAMAGLVGLHHAILVGR